MEDDKKNNSLSEYLNNLPKEKAKEHVLEYFKSLSYEEQISFRNEVYKIYLEKNYNWI